MTLPRPLAILKEACAQSGVAFEVMDDFTGFVARISKDGRSHLVGAAGVGVFPLNRAAPYAIARDKSYTHDVLTKSGFRVPAGAHFFLKPREGFDRPPGRERSDAIRFAEKFSDAWQRPLVIKPNAGKGAKLVSFVLSRESLVAALAAIEPVDYIALVQEFIDEPEFRLFLVDGRIAFAYEKARPSVEGDGVHTIAMLLQEAARTSDPSAVQSDYLMAELRARRLTSDSVLAKGERLTIDFIANISAGGRFNGFVHATPALERWAARLARTVSLRVTGLDVFSRSRLANPEDFIVTDVNGSPNLGTLYDLGHRELVLDVWREILAKTFDPTWPEGF
jgi:glutathione synthase/RimK-type ligase-like ATP-grasp enzyme